MEHALSHCTLIRDAIQNVHELGVLFSKSGKSKQTFKEIAHEMTDNMSGISSIRPLCSTRWLCRLAAIKSVLRNYEAILNCLESKPATSSDAAAKANGLLAAFRKGHTFLALQMAVQPISLLEQLNSSCQAQSATISGVMAAVTVLIEEIKHIRDHGYDIVFREASVVIAELDLDPLEKQRKRNPPRRLCGLGESYHPSSVEEHYRLYFHELLDAIIVHLSERYTNSQSLNVYKEMEQSLLTGKVSEECNNYPELDKDNLSVQLPMFLHSTKANSLHDAKKAYQAMTKEVQMLFPTVFVLLRLLPSCLSRM